MSEIEIKSYRVRYMGGAKSTTSATGGFKYRATIDLYGENGSPIGSLSFYNILERMPETDGIGVNSQIFGNYRGEDLPKVLDILRNEKPVYLGYSEPFKMAYIGTPRAPTEPVGEGEMPSPI